MSNDNKKDYAREELIAEISSSFLMQKLNVDAKAEHFDNHKTYIKSWIEILEDKPNELFKAINESNKVVDYINKTKTDAINQKQEMQIFTIDELEKQIDNTVDFVYSFLKKVK